MFELSGGVFENPVWHALHTKQGHLGEFAGEACRYAAAVAPFAAVSTPTAAALRQLRSLLVSGERVWLFGTNYVALPELPVEGTLDCLQMMLFAEATPPEEPVTDVVRLSGAEAAEMVALTDVAFPGFFRQRTCEMGTYYGIRSGGELVAMGGERLMLEGYPEISGVCTHPEHRGKGLAAGLIGQLVRDHRAEGKVSWLHVGRENHRAIALYRRMGFRVEREVTLSRVVAR